MPFFRNSKGNPKIYMKFKSAKTILKKKNKAEGVKLFNFKA